MHVDLYIIHITKIKLITELLNIFKIVLVYSKQLQSFKNKLGFYAQFSFLPVGDYRDLKDPFLIENKKKKSTKFKNNKTVINQTLKESTY